MRRSFAFPLGVAAGVFFLSLLCGFFSLTVFERFPLAPKIMAWVGAAYILWLAWSTLKSKPPEGGPSQKVGDRLFLHGILLQFVNPNAILYCLTAFATFIAPFWPSPLSLALSGLLLSLTALGGTVCWALLGAAFCKLISRHGALVNAVMAILLAYCALSLIL